MNMRTVVVLILALSCGVSAAIAASFFLAPTEKAPAVTSILVAAVEIPRGSPLEPTFVRMQEWPEGLVPDGALLDYEQLESRIAITGFVPGEPLLENRIAEGTLGAASLVKPGMRAFTIETPTNSSGVAGFVLPGNRVDVLLTMTQDVDDLAGGAGTWTLLQNIEILAADTRLENDGKSTSNELRSVTLLVTPDKATKLTLAANLGRLTLTLRNDADDKIVDTLPVTARELRFLQEAMLAKTNSLEDPLLLEEPNKLPDAIQPVTYLAPGNHNQKPAQIKVLRGNSSSVVTINHR